MPHFSSHDSLSRIVELSAAQKASSSVSNETTGGRPANYRTLAQFAFTVDDPDAFALLTDEIETMLKNIVSRASPSSLRKRKLAELKFQLLVQSYAPHSDPDRLWNKETVLAHYKYMLPFLAATSKGTRGRNKIKASTLNEMMMLFSWAIARNTRDDEGKSIGTSLLAKEGILNELKDQVHTLIILHDLDRHQDEKLVYGDSELKLMIEEGLKGSQNTGRDVALQRLVILNVLFFTGGRPSSFGPSEKKYAKLKQHPMLQDVKIFLKANFTFKIEFKIKNFKAFNSTAAGMSRTFTFESVRQWYNVPFDISMYFVLFLLSRGALKGIKTFDDLRNWNHATIEIKESMLEEPLFLSVERGGLSFAKKDSETGKSIPLGSWGISNVCRILSGNAGLPSTGGYAYRRNFGRRFQKIYGDEAARQMLVHKGEGSLHFYSDNTGGFDVVGTMLDEMPMPLNADKLHLLSREHHHSRAVQAARALLKECRTIEDKGLAARNTRTNRVTLSSEEKLHNVMQDQDANLLIVQLDEDWAAFLACHMEPTNRRPYKQKIQNIKMIQKLPLVPGFTQQQSVEAAEKLRATSKQYVARKAKVLKQASSKARQAVDAVRRTANLGTLKEIGEAMEELKKPSMALLPQSVQYPTILDKTPAIDTLTTVSNAIDAAYTSRPVTGPFSEPIPKRSTQLAAPNPIPSVSVTNTSVDVLSTPLAANSSAVVSTPRLDPATDADAGGATNSPAAAVIAPTEPVSDNQALLDEILNDPTLLTISAELEKQFEGNNLIVIDDEDEHQDKELVSFITNMSNFTGKKSKLNDKPIDRADPLMVTDLEDLKVDDTFNTVDVRIAYAREIMKPIYIQRAVDGIPCEEDGTFKCPRCVRFYHHDSAARQATFVETKNVRRHLVTQHTPWMELSVIIAVRDETTQELLFLCPTKDCDFEGESDYDVREHCITDCKSAALYNRMREQHYTLIDDSRISKVEEISINAIKVYANNAEVVINKTVSRYMQAFKDIKEEHTNAFATIEEQATSIISQSLAPNLSIRHGMTVADVEKGAGYSFEQLLDLYGID